MQAFICPQCGHESRFDPWKEPAHCPECGYTPPLDRRAGDDPAQQAPPPRRSRRGRPQRVPAGSHQRFLDELLAHWRGILSPNLTFHLPDPTHAEAFLTHYQRALGEDPLQRPGRHARYVRSHPPDPKAMLWFVDAYRQLRRGDRQGAEASLRDLTRLYPEFADPWIWLTATTDDPLQRIDYLESAVLLEPAHPLARDALAVALGRVSPGEEAPATGAGPQTIVSKCPQCGGALHYQPGAREVRCQYCGQAFDLQEVNLIDGQATLVGDLRLQRRFQRHTWQEVARIVRCQTCGAELTMTHHLARQCVFCGSSSVLVQDVARSLVQPDGFLPFRLSGDQAAEALQKAQTSGLQRLQTWWIGKTRELQQMQSVYLPFWVFDGFVEVRTSAATRFDRVLERQPPSVRQDLLMFDNLLFSAVEMPPPQLLDKVQPYDLKLLVPYEPRLLADWPAALYQVDVEAAVEEAYDVMLSQALWRAGPMVASQAIDPAQLRRTFQVTSATYQLVLLPIWLALVQREGQQQLALINDQTGKVTFSPPLRPKT